METGSVAAASAVLFKARAAWDYASGVPTELTFSAGDLIEVTEEVSDTWWRGRRQGTTDLGLLFPVIYAEREPDEPALPDDGTEAVSAGSAAAVAAGHARPYRQTLSLHSSERIVRVEIPDAERKITGGELRSWYAVQLQTSRRTVLCEKRFHEFCQAELQLRALFASRMAHVPTLSASARPELYVKKRTARTLEARRIAAEALLQATVVDEAAGTLLLTFFLGSDSEVVAVPALVPASPRAGDADVDGSGGEAATPASVPVAVLGEAPWPVPSAAASAPFSLDDMDAFDALLNTGVTVVAGDLVGVPLGFGGAGGAEGAGGPLAVAIAPRDGQRVRLGLASFVWDGSSSAVRGLMHAPRCELTLGDCRDERLPVGLHTALRSLPCPCAGPFTAIVGPRLAFGDAGLPPAVPAAANIVFVLLVEGIEGVPRSMAALARAPPPPGLTLGTAAGGSAEAATQPDDGRVRVVLAAPDSAAGPTVPFTAQPPRPPGEALLGRPALAATTLAAGVALPPGTIISSSGHIMPSVDAAERAMRAYLASIGQDVPPPPPPPATSRSARTSSAGGGGGGSLMQKLFGGSSSSSGSTPETSPQAAAAGGDGGGGIFKRLFTGGGTSRRPSGSEAAGGDAAAAAAAAAAGSAGNDPAARGPGRWGGGGHVRSATDGGGIRSGGKQSSLAAARLQATAAAAVADTPPVAGGAPAPATGKPPLLRVGSQP